MTANYRLVEFAYHTLQLMGMACFIPPGNMLHSAMKGTEGVSLSYVLSSILSFIIGHVFLYGRMYNNKEVLR